MRPVDMSRLAAGLARAGNDIRHWVSYGTVAAVTGADGGPNYTDPNAVVVTPAGVEVDVVLEPSGYPVTCRYGIQAGVVAILAPVRPGDQVIVVIPDGDVAMVPEIVKVIPGSSNPLPVEQDGMPVFRNDRLSIFARGVPVEIRTDGGGFVRVNADGTVQMGGPDAAEQYLLGTAYRSAQSQESQALRGALDALQAAATGPLAPLQAGFVAMRDAIDAFEGGAGGFLSAKVKGK